MKVFKVGQMVYIPLSDSPVDFALVKGKIVGFRPYITAYSKWRYYIQTPLCYVEADETNIYESVEAFISDVPNRVK